MRGCRTDAPIRILVHPLLRVACLRCFDRFSLAATTAHSATASSPAPASRAACCARPAAIRSACAQPRSAVADSALPPSLTRIMRPA